MNRNTIKTILLSLVCFGLTVFAMPTFAAIPQVQTNSASSIQSTAVGLNGYLLNLGGYSQATVWFQWGTTTSYGNQTSSTNQTYTGQFNQTISGLANNTLYHFRAVSQNSDGTAYGQDMTFTTGASGNNQITVNAGPSIYLNSGQTATLQGYAYDSNGGIVNYSWNCTGGTLSNYYVAQPIFTAPYNAGVTNYTCTLTGSSSNGSSNTASVTIYINTNNAGTFYVQTNSATNISNNQATFNGYVSGSNYSSTVWFQYGTDVNYGQVTVQQVMNNSGSISQNVANLSPNVTYHYRAVAQNNNGSGLVYGQDMTFNSSGYSTGGGYIVPINNYSNGLLTVTKRVINLTSGNLNWQSSVSANQNDLLSFSITLQANNQTINNVFVRDILPAGLIYQDTMALNTSTNYSGNITSGVNIGTVYVNQPIVISYQVRVGALNYGSNTLTNVATVTSNEGGTQTASSSVIVNNQSVLGASVVSTGLTNNILVDSFFLPLLIIVLGLWLYFSGKIYTFANWLKVKRKKKTQIIKEEVHTN